MDDHPQEPRRFSCPHCGKEIFIPHDLPATKAPCPHCGKEVESPPLESAREDSEAVATIEESHQQRTRNGLSDWVLLGGAALVVLIILLLVYLAGKRGEDSTEESHGLRQPARVVPREDARTALEGFLTAKTLEEKAEYLIQDEHVLASLAGFYDSENSEEFRVSAANFAVQKLEKRDEERGLHFMLFNRPEKLSFDDYFLPLAPLRVRSGLEEAELILSSQTASRALNDDRMRVLAFFKEVEGKVKLDWYLYAQTKYRLFRDFVENPKPGRTGIFRVGISEEVDFSEKGGEGLRLYRFSDPAFASDHAKAYVRKDSPLGQLLEPLSWRGKNVRKIPQRNATVRLEWTQDENPTPQFKGLVCWEFLGLGGIAGNWKEELESISSE